MKRTDQRQALWLINAAANDMEKLLSLCADRLSIDQMGKEPTAFDVERLIRRLRDFRAQFPDLI